MCTVYACCLIKTRECVRILSRLDLLYFKSLLRYNSDESCTVVRLLGHYLLHGGLGRNYLIDCCAYNSEERNQRPLCACEMD